MVPPNFLYTYLFTFLKHFYELMVSITVGSNRKHVWTYAVGFNAQAISNCPCASTSAHDAQIFFQDNYYCEPHEDGFPLDAHFTNNPLWDGAGCNGADNNCCADIAVLS